MSFDLRSSRAAGSSASLHRLSRRRFLHAVAAVGGGMVLSLSLPFATGRAEAAELMPSCQTPSYAFKAMGRSC